MVKQGDKVMYKGKLESLKGKVGVVCEPCRTAPDLVVVQFSDSLWKLCFRPENLKLV